MRPFNSHSTSPPASRDALSAIIPNTQTYHSFKHISLTTLQPNFLLPPFLTSPSLLLISFPFKSLFFFPPFNNSRCPALAPSVRSVIAVKPAECFCFPSALRPLRFPLFSFHFPSLPFPHQNHISHIIFWNYIAPSPLIRTQHKITKAMPRPTTSAPLADMRGAGKKRSNYLHHPLIPNQNLLPRRNRPRALLRPQHRRLARCFRRRRCEFLGFEGPLRHLSIIVG